jgi:predicted ATPase/DNA-binding XRE family transcriptional regulator/Tfp pilus assembly protein PilF
MTTPRAPAFGELLRQHRLAAGFTQEELAERARISVRAISDLERGVRRAPHYDTLRLLTEALGLGEEACALLYEAVHETRRVESTSPAAAAQAGAVPYDFPPTLTPLIGREREEAAVAHLLLRHDVRLLTLTGPAGIGKTRLATQVALGLGANFSNVVFISLAAISERLLVLPAIAQALGLRDQADRSVYDQIYECLSRREYLLVLDNFEQIAQAGSEIVRLLMACPLTKALVTSRVALRVRGEHEVAVPPLDTPDLARLPAMDDVVRCAAVALFIQRARAVKPTFEVTPALAPIVAAICVRLDGIPLALELAAARIKTLAPQSLLARLDKSLALLTQGAADLPERQQTMRRAIAWSYEALDDSDQRLFRYLAVFVGGWTLAAVEAVCGQNETEGTLILDGLTTLVNSSLVIQETGVDGEERFHLLELMREYGWEQLVTQDEVSALRSRHADYYLVFAEGAEPELKGVEQAAWIQQLEREHDNLRAALGWAQASEQSEMGLRLAAALERFWELHGHLREGRDWFERLFTTAESSAVATSVRAKALGAAGRLAYRQGDYAWATPLLQQSLALTRAVGNTWAIAGALSNLAILAMAQGDYIMATAQLEESLPLWRISGDRWGLAGALDDLGTVAHLVGDNERAAALKTESLDLARAAGDRSQVAIALHNLGWVVHAQGDGRRAMTLFEESLMIRREVGDTRGVATMLCSMGHLAYIDGDDSRAAPLLTESLTLAKAVGDNSIIAHCLEDHARMRCGQGLAEQAAWLFGATAALREASGASVQPDERADYDRNLATVRAALGDTVFTAAWEHGQALSLDEVIDLVGAEKTSQGTAHGESEGMASGGLRR